MAWYRIVVCTQPKNWFCSSCGKKKVMKPFCSRLIPKNHFAGHRHQCNNSKTKYGNYLSVNNNPFLPKGRRKISFDMEG